MPRVTDAHRRARRDEIAEAAVRVLRRRGVSSTSIAQIVEESGLSAGAIYANFENKADLAQYVAGRLLGWRLDLLEEGTAAGRVRSPLEIVGLVLTTFDDEAPPPPVILQFWAEATIDSELKAVMEAKVTALREAFERAVAPWAERRAPGDPDAAARLATTMIVVCQGWIANAGIFGWTTPEDYLAGLGTLGAGE